MAGTGNTTARGDGFTFVYDARNRYTQYKQNNKVKQANAYNGRGERVARTVGNAVTRFVYDESGRLLAETAGTATTDVVWLDDAPVALVRGAAISYVHTDHLGTPRKVIDPARNVAVWEWPFLGNAFGGGRAERQPRRGWDAVRVRDAVSGAVFRCGDGAQLQLLPRLRAGHWKVR